MVQNSNVKLCYITKVKNQITPQVCWSTKQLKMFKRANDAKKSKIPKNIDTTKYYRYVQNFEYLKDKNYRVVKQLGRGGYGIVYKAQDIKNQGTPCAIKIHFHTILREQVYIEMIMLILASKKNRIARFRDMIEQRGVFHLVLDYYVNHSYITYFSTMNIVQVSHYLYQLLLALKDLKDLGIYHRDVKPGNFMYNKQTKRGKLIDFGLAEVDKSFIKKLQQQIQQLKEDNDPKALQLQATYGNYKKIQFLLEVVGDLKMGTESYMPLESVLMAENQTYSSDIWPVGIIFFQCVSRKYCIFPYLEYPMFGPKDYKQKSLVNFTMQLAVLFGHEKVIQQCDNFGFQLTLPKSLTSINLREQCRIQQFNDTAFDLLIRLLDINPQTRISVQDALDHEFFDEIRIMHQQPSDITVSPFYTK